ncbi:exonuclease domain-containing protein [Paenibacillus sp. UMB4589-SE434]|uniref:exonuclease domain-containing protein n=1 Tax=Paenibacillus sp. UMB4589-SE434 TaxID=3046314 RepID=UPI0025519DD6|nr:exonuclease domain-containing protein [Paenibacillus sp. UMB4589-SE434]MDK8182506.1 exonuclease domain-containing protein [Paenibacillus sp. UMB4589-SE434]
MRNDERRSGPAWLERLRARTRITGPSPSSMPPASDKPDVESLHVTTQQELHTMGARYAYERSLAKQQKSGVGMKGRAQLLDIPLLELPIAVIDLETTGFEPHADEIISFGAWHINGTQWVSDEAGAGAFYTVVNPGIPIPALIEELTGIRNADAVSAVSVGEGLTRFSSFVDGRILIAHASGHDKAFLRAALWRYHKQSWKYRMLDTMLVARWLYPQQRQLDLDSLTNLLGIQNERRHHALYDAQATGALWIQFVEQAVARRVTTLRELYMYLSQY